MMGALGGCRMLWDAAGCYGMLWDAVRFCGMLWDVMGCCGMLRDAAVPQSYGSLIPPILPAPC